MNDIQHIPNWEKWVDRWDRMQENYLVSRSERFEIIADLISATQDKVHNIIDLGCGTGSLTMLLLDRFQDAQIYGVDLDPTLLPLARARSFRFAKRAQFLQVDLRCKTWLESVPLSVDAVVSSTALHWLSKPQIETLYSQISSVLKLGGIFLNADHAASESASIQTLWRSNQKSVLQAKATEYAEDWHSFWDAYLDMFELEAKKIRESALGEWEGIESGLPLAWHFDQLRKSGFSYVDCFWRNYCDAIYGGIK
ncbi:MAG: class I SAM-dependent methyltransferase [Armatimonadota bacterium]